MATRLSPASRAALLVAALLVSFSGGAVAKAKYDAKNADKVDGKHAVSSTKQAAKRTGKLVATGKSGRLPNNIIAKAPDAAKLGGVPAAALRTLTFPITSAGESSGVNDGSQVNNDEVNLDQANSGSLSWNFTLPADRVAGGPIYADLLYQDGSTAACSWFATTGAILEQDDGSFANYAWSIPGGGNNGPIDVPAGAAMAQRITFQLIVNDRGPGDLITFTLGRTPDDPADNCNFGIRIKTIQFRY